MKSFKATSKSWFLAHTGEAVQHSKDKSTGFALRFEASEDS